MEYSYDIATDSPVVSNRGILDKTDECYKGKIHLVEIKSVGGMTAIKNDWNKLLLKSQNATPFQSWEWNYAFVEDFKISERLKIIAGFNEDSELIAVAPLKLTRHFVPWITVLEFIGSGPSDYSDFLILEEYKLSFLKAFFDYIEENKDWTILNFKSLRENTVKLISRELCVEITPQTVCPLAILPDTMEQFENEMNKKELTGVKRQLRKLLSENRLTYSVLDSPKDLKEGIDNFISLHQERHNSKGERGKIYSKRQRERFHRFSVLMCGVGLLKIETLKIDNRVVAANFILAQNKKMYNYLSGMDPQYSKFKPGKILIYYMIKDAIKKGYKVYDFLQGDEKYKYYWTNNEVKLYNVSYSRSKKRVYVWEKRKELRRAICNSHFANRVYQAVFGLM